jgi:hypothetical protein
MVRFCIQIQANAQPNQQTHGNHDDRRRRRRWLRCLIALLPWLLATTATPITSLLLQLILEPLRTCTSPKKLFIAAAHVDARVM